MSSIKNVLVVGANGNLGPVIVKHLLSANFNVSILTREGSTSDALPNVKVFQTDYSETSLAQAFKDQDAIVSTIGVAGKALQMKLIDAAIANNRIKRFIPSDYSYKSYDMSEIERRIPLIHQRLAGNRVTLHYLEEKAAQNPSFTWTALGGGVLFDWTLKVGFLGTSLSSHTSTIIDSGNEPYSTVTIPQIGRAIVSVLQHPAVTANQYLTISSFVTTQNKVLAAAEAVKGQKFEVKKVDADSWHKEGEEMFSKGDFRGLGKMWGSFFWKDGEGGAKDPGEGNELLGLSQEDVEEVIRGVAGL